MTLSNKELPIQSVLTSLTQQDIRQWQEMKDPNWIRYSCTKFCDMINAM